MTVHSDATQAVASIQVRLASVADAPRIAQLAGQLGYPSTAEEVIDRLRGIEGDPRHVVYLAELVEVFNKTEIVGFVHAQERCLVIESDRHAEIAALVVDERFRGRGVGRLLMRNAEDWARNRSASAMVLRSNVIRSGAHAFYEKLGYSVVKTQKVFRKDLPGRR